MSDRTPERCSVDGCCLLRTGHRIHCRLHDQRLRKYGDPGPAGRLRARVKRPEAPAFGTRHDTELCAWWGGPCEHLVYSQDLCKRHYNRALSAGDNPPLFKRTTGRTQHEMCDADDGALRATCRTCGPGVAFEWRASDRGQRMRRQCVGARNANGRWLSTGWSEVEYDLALIAQGNRCAICENSPEGRGVNGVLHADHCHSAKKTRALLCGKCNQMIGLGGDDPETLLNAAIYIAEHQNAVLPEPEGAGRAARPTVTGSHGLEVLGRA